MEGWIHLAVLLTLTLVSLSAGAKATNVERQLNNATTSPRGKRLSDRGILLQKNDAYNFFKRQKRQLKLAEDWKKPDFRSECCSGPGTDGGDGQDSLCVWEEWDEKRRDWGGEIVPESLLCEYSIKEDRKCTCRQGSVNFECGRSWFTKTRKLKDECYNPKCFVNYVDYYGHDLDNMPVTTTSDMECQRKCNAEERCFYFTWNQDRNKCYLKSSNKGKIRVTDRTVSGPKKCSERENLTPCPRDWFWCDRWEIKMGAHGRNIKNAICLPPSQKCDSNNDCGDWKDEKNCKISLVEKATKLVKGGLTLVPLKNARQSSTEMNYKCAATSRDSSPCSADKAIDRKSNTGSLQWEGTTIPPWWLAEFSTEALVDSIYVTLHDYYLKEGSYQNMEVQTAMYENGPWTTCAGPMALTEEFSVIRCNKPTRAKFVKFQSHKIAVFSLIQVDVAAAQGVTEMRNDWRCGPNHLVNGQPGSCDPKQNAPCCSSAGWCVNSDVHCRCNGCQDFILTQTSAWFHRKYQCVHGHGIEEYKNAGKTLQECKRLCQNTPSCKAIVFGVDGRDVCELKSGTRSDHPCDAKRYKLDMYVKLPDNYYGNVEVMNRPVCDKGWDETDAKVICKMLSKNGGKMTKAIPWTGSRFGSVLPIFRMTEVNCQGDEKDISKCPHKTKWDGCGPNNGAGVTCVDFSTTKLVDVQGNEQTDDRERNGGEVMVNDEFVCSDGWTEKSSEALCRTMFAGEFKLRCSDPKGCKVPVFSTRFIPWEGETSIRNVVCDGSEENLSKCQISQSSVDRRCNSKKKVQVQCAVCRPEKLVQVITNIKTDRKTSEIAEIVKSALDDLKKSCLDWDCSVEDKPYKEYCETVAALEQALLYLKKPKSDVPFLQTSFSHKDLLKANVEKKSTEVLKTQIYEIGNGVKEFRKTLADNFKELAEFDRVRSFNNMKDMNQQYTTYKAKIKDKVNKVGNLVGDIYKAAFSMITLEIAERTRLLGMAIVQMCSPIEVLTDAVGGALQMLDAVKNVAVAGVKLTALTRAFVQENKGLVALAERLKKQEKKTFDGWKDMKKVIGNEQPMTKKIAIDFLKNYGNFNPSMTPEDIAEYRVRQDILITTACDTIDSADTIPGAVVAGVAAGMGFCPDATKELEILTEMYYRYWDVQNEMVDHLADLARAKLAEEGARKLGNTKFSALDQKIDQEIARLNSKFLLQSHKETLIKDACSYITYKNHGKEEPVCTELMDNPYKDASRLTAYKFDTDMCAGSTSNGGITIVSIPAIVVRREKEYVPLQHAEQSYSVPSCAGCVADKAMDGDDSTSSKAKRAPAGRSPWWQVELTKPADIVHIEVTTDRDALERGYYDKFKVEMKRNPQDQWRICRDAHELDKRYHVHIIVCEPNLNNTDFKNTEAAKYILLSVAPDAELILYEVRVMGVPETVVPDGTLDLTSLYATGKDKREREVTRGSSDLKIPNREYLEKHGWIEDVFDNGEELFLRWMEIFVPSGFEGDSEHAGTYKVSTRIEHVGHCTLNGKKYSLPPVIWSTTYREKIGLVGSEACPTNEKILNNLYNDANCVDQHGKVCLTNEPAAVKGEGEPIYPSLTGSSWKIYLASKVKLTAPQPNDIFYIRARVQLCKKASSLSGRDSLHPLKRDAWNYRRGSTCCKERGMVLNLLEHGYGGDPCKNCANPSVPRLKGYYCELCPPGYEQMGAPHTFGCSPCGVGFFKEKAGTDRCQKCPVGYSTRMAKGQSKCFKV